MTGATNVAGASSRSFQATGHIDSNQQPFPKSNPMTLDELVASATNDSQPPADLSEELQAMWHTKAGNWEDAHNIAQDIPSAMGSWIHALLHLIEGDIGNAGYWFNRAGKPKVPVDGIDELWTEIASELLA